MRVGLLSDSHGSLENAMKAIEAMDPLDLLIHAGDHYRDAVKISAALNLSVQAVVGNCDGWDDGPEEQVLELEGARLFITHGHRYNVKLAMTNLLRRATELQVDAVIYGHTHIPEYHYVKEKGLARSKKLLVINPGSISRPRIGDSPSYGILEIKKGSIKPVIMHLKIP